MSLEAGKKEIFFKFQVGCYGTLAAMLLFAVSLG